jgi:hypothetical protein
LNVNTEFGIALYSSRDGVDESTQHTRRYPLEDWIPSRMF